MGANAIDGRRMIWSTQGYRRRSDTETRVRNTVADILLRASVACWTLNHQSPDMNAFELADADRAYEPMSRLVRF